MKILTHNSPVLAAHSVLRSDCLGGCGFVAVLGLLVTLSGCDGHSGSGVENQLFPNTNELDDVVNYSGPAPKTTDIQNFKLRS